MIRYVAILSLILGGLPGLGLGLLPGRGGGHVCEDGGCHTVVIGMSCCGEPVEADVCEMSGGPCRCVSAPIPDPTPRPEAPKPGGERVQLLGVMDPTARVEIVVEAPRPAVTASATDRSRPGRTHNELQALLGIWRT